MTAPNFSGPTSVVALVDGSGNPATGANSIPVQGNVASGATDSGNPVKVGGQVLSADPSFSNGQRADVTMDTTGFVRVNVRQAAIADADASVNTQTTWVQSGGSPMQLWVRPKVFNGTTWDRQRGDVVATSVLPGLSSTYWTYAPPTGGITSSTAGVTAKTAAGASVRNYVAGGMISWSTLSAATEFVIRDGAAGTVLWRVTLPTVAGIIPLNFNVPLRGTANTLVEIAAISSVTGNIHCTLQGFTGA